MFRDWIISMTRAEWMRARRDGGCSIHSINMNVLVTKYVVGLMLNPKEHREESGVFSTIKEPQ